MATQLSEETIPNIKAGVPQDSDISPIPYNIFNADIPNTNQTFLVSFSDDIAILSLINISDIVPQNLQLKSITKNPLR